MWRDKKLADIAIDRSDVSTTIRSMRRALQEMEHHHPLLRMAACHTRHHGLSGEDQSTFLAYELLSENERLKEFVLQRAMMEPVRMFIAPEGLKPGDIQPAPALDTTAEDALMEVWKRLNGYFIGDGQTGRKIVRDALVKLGRLKEFTPGVFEEVRRG